jgi:hypothetical protein
MLYLWRHLEIFLKEPLLSTFRYLKAKATIIFRWIRIGMFQTALAYFLQPFIGAQSALHIFCSSTLKGHQLCYDRKWLYKTTMMNEATKKQRFTIIFMACLLIAGTICVIPWEMERVWIVSDLAFSLQVTANVCP